MSWREHIFGATILTLTLVIYLLVFSLQEYKDYVGDVESLKEGLSVCNERLTLRSESCELVWRKKNE